MDHQGEFQLLVDRHLGREVANDIDWSAPRLICVANDFTRFDEHAVRQIDRNVELVRYRDFGSDLLAIELITTTTTGASTTATSPRKQSSPEISSAVQVGGRNRTAADLLAKADQEIAELYESFEAFALSLGDDVVKNERKNYFAFRRLKNFACVEVHPSSRNLLVYLKLEPVDVEMQEGFIRDVTNIGHFGTGDVELRVKDRSSWQILEDLTRRAYEAN